MHIRTAANADLDGLIALYRHLNHDDPAPEPAQAQTAFAAILASPLTTIFLVEAEGRPVSCCTLVIVPNLTRGARPYALIENVVTDAAHRRRGLGQAVLAAAMAAAWEAGCYKIMLASGSKNEATLRFYENAGFERGTKTFFQARTVAY